MRSVVSYLVEKSETASPPIISKPVYFFFDDKDSTRKDSMAFVRSILDQIIRDSRTSYLLTHLDERDLLAKELIEDNLWMCLGTILERSRGIMFQFVVDAMDEVLRSSTSYSLTILDRLERLLSIDSSGRIRLLISSRKKPTTEFLEANLAFVDVDNEMTRENVDSYIRTQVGRWIERFHLSTSVGESIEKKIMDVSQGNFLHARLALKQFSEGVQKWSREDVRISLDRLSRVSHGLASVYCDLLKSIPEQQMSQAKAAFAILRVTKEKLNSQQLSFFATLYHLKVSNSNNDQVTVEAVKSQSDDFERYLEETCGYIIRRADDGIVDFTHVSAKDLFTEPLEGLSPQEKQTIAVYTMSEPDASLMMHKLCMEILQLERRDATVWRSELSKLQSTIKDRIRLSRTTIASEEDLKEAAKLGMSYIRSIGKTPCILYAVQNWMHHYAAGRPDDDTDSRLAAFLRTVPAYYYHMFWYSIGAEYKQHQTTYERTHTRTKASTLDGLFRAVVREDCPRVVKAIIANGTTINGVADEKEGITPMSWTVICQRKESFLVLLRNDCIQINYAMPGSQKPLHYAARSMDAFYLAKLLGCGNINVNITSNAGTPLHAAIKSLNVTAARLLVDHPDIDIWAKHTSEDGTKTPYSLAFRNGAMESVLEKMINIRSKNLAMKISGTSQFFLAGVHRWERVEEIILRTEPHQVLEVDSDTGMNALESYAFFGRRKKLLWILDRLPHRFPIRVTHQKYDLLHLCADQNWRDVVDLLRERYGLTSLMSDHVGRTLLHWALEYNWDISATNLEEYSPGSLDTKDRDGLTALHIAISNRNMDALKLLVSSGANFLLKDKNEMSPVHLAADQGFRAALEYFINMPQQDFGTTKTGASLLHLLSLWFDGAFIRHFVTSKKAIVDVVDKNRRTPLHYAALVNNVSAVTQLLELGCKINVRDQNGMTPLHEAIRDRNTETTLLLLDSGADTRIKDAFEQSCLHLSLRYGHDDLVARFLKNSSKQDIDAVDRFGMTPLHRACGTGRVGDVKSLRKLGANWNVRNKYGRYPIDLAVEAKSTTVLKAMISWAQNSGHSHQAIDQCLKSALILACEIEAIRIKDILVGIGLQVDQSKIKVRQLYMSGPEREDRWPVVLYPWKRETGDTIW
jgi:ankyrin repeat protein